MTRDARFDKDRHGSHGTRHRRRKWHERAEDFGPSPNKLYRDPVKGKVMGVCAGVADYFGVEVWMVRLATLFALIFFFVPTVIGYFIAGFVLQPKPEELYYEDEEEDDFWRGVRTDPTQTFSALRHKFKELEQRLRGLETYVTSREFRLRREFDDLERGAEMMAARPAGEDGAPAPMRRPRLPDLVRTALAHDGLMLVLVALLILVTALF